ncbi:MAG TPA: pentapeptide repeat-containing protein [Oscillatoriaceae cyanobacterium M33_DOE_052]|uniref:Pentapeptide repeat-containing protein n=1 Tax=Planktothricoides sp. SpSt-374 TaxID=2282167 RepID=A0A7C3VH51_9CYAN|nr:pentapeptide repeat-containing protein [Oscillatoriaceae cyanobacterium M33_DOE_052]
MRLLVSLFAALVLFVSLTSGALAAPLPPVLTTEVLQERIKQPVTIEGFRVIDLRDFTIDLRPENQEFRSLFYQSLQIALNKPGTTVGLDLSQARILGDFAGKDLGLRLPLFGEALSPMFTPEELEQIQKDRRRLSQLGQFSGYGLTAPMDKMEITTFRGAMQMAGTRFLGAVDWQNTFFLNRLEASGAEFKGLADWSASRFGSLADFTNTSFQKGSNFRGSIFFDKSNFHQVQFEGETVFSGSVFAGNGTFSQSVFQGLTDFSRSIWQGNSDLSLVRFGEAVRFTGAKFEGEFLLRGATFAQAVSFRETRFNFPANLREASILNKADFSDAGFAPGAYLNVAELAFDSDQATLAGDTGRIGKALWVPTLQENETVLRNLVRNFRQQEQIPDANQVEYLRSRLWLQQLGNQFLSLNINNAQPRQLEDVGFSPPQVAAILLMRQKQPCRNLTELLSLEEMDFATYIKVRDKAFCRPFWGPMAPLLDALQWLGLSLLILLSRYGTSSWLVLGVGILSLSYFGFLFWLVDRSRRRLPQPILPTIGETISVIVSAAMLGGIGLFAIFSTAGNPWLTLACLAVFLLPVPLIIVYFIYKRGRYHDLLNVSYFVEDGSMRQLRLTVGRLPVIPRFPGFRDRYAPILWNRRWNWLNYYDFSLNNLLKFGFNDIRLRDEHLPGLVSALVWYQWSLGILYLTLLLWTISRTIPGLNLLIYLR